LAAEFSTEIASVRLASSAQVMGLCSFQRTEGGTMPWKIKNPEAADIAPDWLQPYCKQFMLQLADQGYVNRLMGFRMLRPK
jgi:hypothetical protein